MEGERAEVSFRLEQMRRNPKADWKIADVKYLCDEFQITCDPPRGGGSHYKIAHPKIAEKLAVPYKRPIKPVYIRMLVAMVDKIRSGT